MSQLHVLITAWNTSYYTVSDAIWQIPSSYFKVAISRAFRPMKQHQNMRTKKYLPHITRLMCDNEITASKKTQLNPNFSKTGFFEFPDRSNFRDFKLYSFFYFFWLNP